MLVNWYHRDDIDTFNQEYADITEGEQFPSEKQVSKQLDLALNRFDGHKISTDFSSNAHDNLKLTGVNDTSE